MSTSALAACPGFRFAGVTAGIKSGQRPDLGLIVADEDVPVAAVFTRNRVRAAPVELSEEHVKAGLARAIIVNSGNANACTGEKGRFDAAAMAEYTARAVGCDKKRVLVASTGVIGRPLPIERIVEATPGLYASLHADGIEDFTRAIMTTDRFEKRALHMVPFGPKTKARVIGVAKGAGMIAPNMGTTLAFLCTDAAVSKAFLRKVLAEEVESTFNRVSVDGDTSTNDSVFLMASGAARNRPIDSDAGGKGEAFRKAVHDTLADLARQIVRDGEGATHVVTIEVLGAPSSDGAEAVARRIAGSPLCKTAFFGADPNWGRILAAIGNVGLDIDHHKIDVAVGEVELVHNSAGLGDEAEKRAHEVMRRGEYTLRVHLHAGRGTATHTTCDLTVDYVKLNADYRS